MAENFNQTYHNTTTVDPSLKEIWTGIFSQINSVFTGSDEYNPYSAYIGLFHICSWTNVVWSLSNITVGVLFACHRYY